MLNQCWGEVKIPHIQGPDTIRSGSSGYTLLALTFELLLSLNETVLFFNFMDINYAFFLSRFFFSTLRV